MTKIKNLFAATRLKQEFADRRNKLYRVAYSWCHNTALADDLVQETMLKAMKKADSLRNQATLDTWLYRILLNNWHDYLRVQGRNVELYDVGDEGQPEHADNYQQSQIVGRVRSSVERFTSNVPCSVLNNMRALRGWSRMQPWLAGRPRRAIWSVACTA